MIDDDLKDAQYSELPRDTFSVKWMRLYQYNPGELDVIEPPQPVPMPPNLSESQRRKLANLPQYRGWRPAAWRRSLGNLARRLPHMTDDFDIPEPEMLQPPDADTHLAPPGKILPPDLPRTPEILGGENSEQCRSIRACLSQQEWRLFVETWNLWMADHAADYVHVEDFDDLRTICLEKVIQTRMLLLQNRRPETFDYKAYDASVKRMKEAREALDATRSARQRIALAKNSKGGTNVSVSIVAGYADKAQIKKKEIEVLEAREVEEGFFEATLDRTQDPKALPEHSELPDPEKKE